MKRRNNRLFETVTRVTQEHPQNNILEDLVMRFTFTAGVELYGLGPSKVSFFHEHQ